MAQNAVGANLIVILRLAEQNKVYLPLGCLILALGLRRIVRQDARPAVRTTCFSISQLPARFVLRCSIHLAIRFLHVLQTQSQFVGGIRMAEFTNQQLVHTAVRFQHQRQNQKPHTDITLLGGVLGINLPRHCVALSPQGEN